MRKRHILEYLAHRENVPEFIVKYPTYKEIIDQIARMAKQIPVTRDEFTFDSMLTLIAESTQSDKEDLKDYYDLLIMADKSEETTSSEMHLVPHTSLSGIIQEVLAETLTERQRRIITLLYMKDMTQAAVGRLFGLTRERIRIIELNALRKIREKRSSQRKLEDYVEDYI